jgi:hypothetical protein
MAAKKKTKKKTKKTASKQAAGKKKLTKKPAKARAPGKKVATKKTAPQKSARQKTLPPRAVVAKKLAPSNRATAAKKSRRNRSSADLVTTPEQPRARLGGQAGDLQGLSRIEGADSESVDELLEEGNAFEADVIRGVERAGESEEEEVHTHEVPEDDVPGEYLDEE